MVDPYQANLYLKFKKLSTQGKMKVKIRKSGNSFVLTIPKVLRDLYNWKEGTEVDLRLNSDGIIIESSHSSWNAICHTSSHIVKWANLDRIKDLSMPASLHKITDFVAFVMQRNAAGTVTFPEGMLRVSASVLTGVPHGTPDLPASVGSDYAITSSLLLPRNPVGFLREI